jgi:signal transduction histidine kinase/ActR/RegA family two-component response regulator
VQGARGADPFWDAVAFDTARPTPDYRRYVSVNLDSVLLLSGELQRAANLGEVVKAAQAAVARTSRYRTTWLIALEDTAEGRWFRILAMDGAEKENIWERAPRFAVGNDPFLLEILQADHPVIVEDMRTDPRTDKEVVALTDHRTGICIPLCVGSNTLGALCVGTFGAEGVIPPTTAEVENLTVITSLVAAAFDRVLILAQKQAVETRAKELAAEGQVLQEQLRHFQRFEAVGQLAGGIAHDFNNLLTAIAGHASLCLDITSDRQVAESLDVILEATKRAAYLTHNLLSFSRRRVLTRRAFDLDHIVEHAHHLFRPALRADITVRYAPAASPVYVLADDIELEHALINLVTNARDAIEGEGEIAIAVETRELDDEFVARYAGKLAGNCAVITVTDTGSGMDAATLERIYEPFFSTKAVGRGTGLGLVTVQSIVEQHGGVMTVESQLGAGTRFTIYLPMAAAAPARAEVSPLGVVSGAGETILLAEDDDLVRQLLTRVLRGQGYRVLEAADGQSAIEMFREASADIALVLTDLMMPRRSGLELVDAVLAFKQATPVVVMSGFTSDPEGAKRLNALGMTVINKPTTPTDVLAKVRQALDAGAMRP